MAKANDFTVIYNDDDILVLNKRSGLLVAGDRYDSEAPRLDLLAEKEFGRLYAVHRIDKDTSGIVIYAKNADAHRSLSMQFENREVQKTYHALVNGRVTWEEKNNRCKTSSRRRRPPQDRCKREKRKGKCHGFQADWKLRTLFLGRSKTENWTDAPNPSAFEHRGILHCL